MANMRDDVSSTCDSEMSVSMNEETMQPMFKAAKTQTRKMPQMKRETSDLSKHKHKINYKSLPLKNRETIEASVYVCGTGDCGQLGLGDDIYEVTSPVLVKALENERIVDIFCGGMHVMALTSQGQVWSWGNNDQNSLGRSGNEIVPNLIKSLQDKNIVYISCSDSATLFIDNEGKMYLCGCFRTIDGLLGATREIEILKEPITLPELLNVKFVDSDAGSDHFVLLDDKGQVWCFGDGIQYQLGRRVIQRRRLNSLMPIHLNLKHIVSVGAGAYHSFAIDEEGITYSWGLNNYGQCGIGSCTPHIVSSPTPVESLKNLNVKKIRGGEHFSVALTESGQLYSWGRADLGQLGLDVSTLDPDILEGSSRVVLKPTLISTLSHVKIIQFYTGSTHCIALSDTGSIYSWGFGETGCLCLSDTNDYPLPKLVNPTFFKNRTPIKTSAGAQHTVILASKNKIALPLKR